MLDTLKEKVTNKVWKHIRDYFYEQRIMDAALVQNINFSAALQQKKAVVCYMTTSHFFDWERNNIGRTQPFEVLSIVKVLSELGYCVDIVGCNDTRSLEHIKAKSYSLIFGFGEAFYQLTRLQPQATAVLYMTEHHPDFSHREEQKRLDYFYARHRKQAHLLRSGTFYKAHHLEKPYAHLITMSEVEPFKDQYQRPYTIFPTGIRNPDFVFRAKQHQAARKHFLWLGSTGAIHKGLDLLLDVFAKRTDVVLHIGGLSNSDRKILSLPQKQNIVDYGHIDIKSDTFLRLVETCAYVVLPSCSEGFATSITTGMLHGLIPVVMKDTGFNRLGELAVFWEDFSVDYLDCKITELAEKPAACLAALSSKVYDFAAANFSLPAFEQNFRTILQEILADHA